MTSSISCSKALLTTVILLFVCLVSSVTCEAQKRSSDFIATDSTVTTGKISHYGNGKMTFRRHRNAEPIVFGPEDVREYGSNGNIYESVVTDGQRLFYRRLATGPASLFKSHTSYFLKINDSITYLTKKNYRSILEQKLVCEGGSELVAAVGYNGGSMANFVNRVNRGMCRKGYLPYRKFGIYGGYNLIQFDVEFSQSGTFSDGANAMTVGLFVDYPLYKTRSLYLTGELLVSTLKPSFYTEEGNRTKFVGMDITSFMLPLGVKWVFPDGNVVPYIKAGAAFSYLKFNSSPEYFTTTTTSGIVEVTQGDVSVSKSIQVGLNAGAGLEFPLGKRKNVHIECKYLNSYDVSEINFQANFSGLFFIVGFNI